MDWQRALESVEQRRPYSVSCYFPSTVAIHACPFPHLWVHFVSLYDVPLFNWFILLHFPTVTIKFWEYTYICIFKAGRTLIRQTKRVPLLHLASSLSPSPLHLLYTSLSSKENYMKQSHLFILNFKSITKTCKSIASCTIYIYF